MHDPVTGFIGFSFKGVIAGFAGGVVSLTFLKKAGPIATLLSFIGGGLVAVYMGPLFYYLLLSVFPWEFLQGEQVETGIVFLTGVFGMSLLAGMSVVMNRFRDEPLETIKDLKDLKK